MTKSEFLLKVPHSIKHKTNGYGELEVVVNNYEKKGICYRHNNKLASCGTYASSWDELFGKLSKHLTSEGYIN